MTEKNRDGEWIYELYKDGEFFARRSLTCGKIKALAAQKQWESKGYQVVLIQQPWDSYV